MENKILEVLREAALAGAAAIKTEKAARITKTEKSPGEFVTNCDLASEKAIISILRGHYPESSVLSEEAGKLDGNSLLWVIDPIDGTHNFMCGSPVYGISIAAYEKGSAVAGVIHFPELGATYHASHGGGAFLNENKISVSGREKLSESFIAYTDLLKNELALRSFGVLASQCFKLRISGCAVFDLASVASGVIDARVFYKTKPVDFAAGALLVEEAGGKVTALHGESYTLETSNLLVSNGKIHKELYALLHGDSG